MALGVSGQALAAALALAAFAVPAVAQNAPPADPAQSEDAGGQDIVVTGIRASLASSAAIKRDQAMIVDSISAEDIGKLPDVSIADSLARLPGVTAQRLEGRDQRLSIRGLGPDFSTTLLNGREQVTVGDNRGVEYDQYPSEFFKTVNVYKSADASLIAAGIAGTVDLRMLRPLESKRAIVVSARGQMNEKDKLNPDGTRYGYRASATYVDKFANDTLGIAIGLSAQSTPTQIERYAAWGFPTEPAAGGNLFLGGAKPYVQSNLLKRYGGVATVEWEPSENFHSTFDALYSNFEETQRLRGIEFPVAPTWGSNAVIQPGYTVENGLVTEATLTNVVGVQRNDFNKRTAKNLSLGWNNDFRLSDTIHFVVDASWSRATRTDFLLETYSGTGYNQSGAKDTIHISHNGDGTYDIVPTIDYTDTGIISLTDPRGWGFNGTQTVVQAGFLNRPDFTDDLKSLRASFNGEIAGSIFSRWEVGGNFSRREKQSRYKSYFLCPPGGGTNCTVASGTPLSFAVPADAVLDEQVSLDYLGVPAMLTYDPLKVYGLLNQVFDNRPDSLVRDNVITEKVWTGYAKLAVDGTVGGKALKGSLGFQVVHTIQGSTGQIAALQGGAVTTSPVADETSYTHFLPSATFSVELEDGFFIKLGAAKTMIRPRLDQERITQAVSIDFSKIGLGSAPQNSPFSSNGGNFALKPYQSTNIDVSFEKYFHGGGYLALTGFFKHLTDFVDPNDSVLYDFSPLLSVLPPAQRAIVVAQNAQFGLVKQPANTGRGEILGVEATASLPFGVFSSALDGFGIFASGSYVDSKIVYANNSPVTLPGQSKWIASGTAYFEKNGFQARATYRWRDEFLAELAGLSANPEYRTGKAEGVLDAQIGYEFQSGPLTGLSILAQAKNITDAPFVTTEAGDQRLAREYQRYGRDYYLGLTYKF
ncbi:iron complex outermembrane receptor protein [Sphingomonas naasensis]|uniref:TonB-dependent receptor n=1 Tax=Sphingomonas naasensis TaxID=1344951 RepID=A0A4S1WKX2_9SPHN|nr:TonB-dependent receptor [Sphingomonas naasensis]NIJ21677.1 iron complex outermembrane receptor protein [Sphingomonas naasensis]TGX41656.1 TonB-dependent receptor [Sphingomonas naasensis]